jgi:Ribonuclease G/E
VRRELLIAAGPGEWRAALIEDGAAAELYIERGDMAPAGSIHLGRVVRLVGGLDAALVEIGDERPAFLPLPRQPGVGARLDEGARVLVQVRREAQRGKAAQLTLRLSEEDAACYAETAAGTEPPARLLPAPGFAAALAQRLPGGPELVLTDDAAILPELRVAFAGAEVAHRRAEEWPLDLDAAFDTALSRSLALPGGGSVHIEDARAAVLIDVDTGSPETGSAERTAMAANLPATAVIARELRLRQLGGGILIDFAALEGRGPRERVRQAMTAALAADPARPQVLGWSRLGHLEIVRPRRLRPLSEAMLEPGVARKGATALAFEALRVLAREARARPAANWRLLVSPPVEAALRGPAAAGLRALEQRLGRTIAVAVDLGMAAPFDIVAR